MPAAKKARFFDGYTDEHSDTGTGGEFLTAEEKELLIEEGVGFPILSVGKADTKFGERYMVGTELEGEPRMIGFSTGKVFSRDRALDAIKLWLETGGAAPVVKIVISGRSQLLVDAE